MKQTAQRFQTQIEPGAVVARNDDEALRLLTVETVQIGPFGDTARCIWFGSGDHLRFEDVPLRILDLFPHPVSKTGLSKGDEVRIRGGGPVMTILRLDEESGLALCEWDGAHGHARCRAFPAICLTHSMFSE